MDIRSHERVVAARGGEPLGVAEQAVKFGVADVIDALLVGAVAH
jgi:hypothetical protein